MRSRNSIKNLARMFFLRFLLNCRAFLSCPILNSFLEIGLLKNFYIRFEIPQKHLHASLHSVPRLLLSWLVLNLASCMSTNSAWRLADKNHSRSIYVELHSLKEKSSYCISYCDRGVLKALIFKCRSKGRNSSVANKNSSLMDANRPFCTCSSIAWPFAS